jgi:hypothetical protein
VERFSLLKDKEDSAAAAPADAADEQQKDSAKEGVVASNGESEKEATISNKAKKGLFRKIMSRLPFRRRHSNKD